MKKFTAIVLAAGKGLRMRSNLPKVLHSLKGRPFICYILRELISLRQYISQIIVITGYKRKIVEKEIRKWFPNQCELSSKEGIISFVYQKNLMGTAHALRCAEGKVKHDNILVICADTPLITRDTIASFLSFHSKEGSLASLISANCEKNNELGVVMRDSRKQIKAIKERVDIGYLSEFKEVNSGIYAFDRRVLFDNLKKITKNEKKNEYFLTDIAGFLYTQGYPMNSYLLNSKKEEILGINTPRDLCYAEIFIQQRIIDKFIAKGVRIINPQTTFIEQEVKIGRDTVIYPFTFIEKNVIIGSNCSLGPFIHLREGTRIKEHTHLGNFVEVNRSNLGRKVKMKHFGYLGDVAVGDSVNIGAGTVVANFDGRKKNKTLIEKDAFIGSDTVLVAPLKVGKGAVTGAGSVVTKDVKSFTVVAGVPARFIKKQKSKKH